MNSFPTPVLEPQSDFSIILFIRTAVLPFRPLHINCISVLFKSLTTPRREHSRYLFYRWRAWSLNGLSELPKKLLVQLKLTTRCLFFSPFLTLTLCGQSSKATIKTSAPFLDSSAAWSSWELTHHIHNSSQEHLLRSSFQLFTSILKPFAGYSQDPSLFPRSGSSVQAFIHKSPKTSIHLQIATMKKN